MADKDTTANRKNTDRKPNAASLANLRKGGGRPKGSPNKATASLKEAARGYTEQALQTLVQIALEGESEAARVSAANAILDRGYGKPTTVLAGDDEGGPVALVQKIVLEGVAPK